VFTFDSINIPAGVAVSADLSVAAANSRPVAFLSLLMAKACDPS